MYIQLIYVKAAARASTTSYLNLRAIRVTAFVLFSHSRTRAPLHTRCRISTLNGGMGRGRGRGRGRGKRRGRRGRG